MLYLDVFLIFVATSLLLCLDAMKLWNYGHLFRFLDLDVFSLCELLPVLWYKINTQDDERKRVLRELLSCYQKQLTKEVKSHLDTQLKGEAFKEIEEIETEM
jgi:signal transduction histidine kinase